LEGNDELQCSVGLEDDNNFFKWNVVFEGPPDTLYEVSSLIY
jgi:ubiquitin-protein ligase